MRSFTYFDIYDYAVIGVLLLISLYVVAYLIKRIKRDKTKKSMKIAKINIVAGIVLILISIILFVYIETNIYGVITILQPISIMSLEPLVLFSIILLLSGIVLITSGIYLYSLFKKLKNGAN